MPLSEVAKWFGPAAGLCMGLGIWGGGALVNWLGKRDLRAFAYVPGLAVLVTAPTLALAVMASSWQASLLLMLVPMVACTMFTAPVLALVQNLMPVNKRATATALVLLAFNIVGLGCGPLVIGMVSDALSASGAEAPLRTALLCATPVAVLSALAYWGVTRVVGRDAEVALKEATQ